MMSVMPTPAPTGRGAWSKRGNLLGKSLYLRGASASITNCDTQDKWAVNRAVLAIQIMLNRLGYSFDYSSGQGIFGPLTDKNVRAFQSVYAAPADGIVGPNTARALVRAFVSEQEKANGIPDRILWGLIGAESGWDFGAVGYYTPKDLGICQYNTYYNQSLSPDQIMDPTVVIPMTAKRIRTRFNEYSKYTTDPQRAWDAAILAHNSPARALTYAKTGVYPTEQARTYVERVRKATQVA
jgi:peptidoglycan hydrolase-like protein with peptidoglycan-binding domain